MPPIVVVQNLSKAYGAAPLFQDVSFTISEGDRIGLIGPNGSGKSTLLQILAGGIRADSGEVVVRKLTRLSYVSQEPQFAEGSTVRLAIEQALQASHTPHSEWEGRAAGTLGRAGFDDFDQPAALLSGGWRKRLAVASALVQEPDILLLDEPTNHLDIGGIEWLEGLIQTSHFACVVVSHDRYFLENVASSMIELNRAYPEGMLRVAGNYSQFLEKKEEFLEAQEKRQRALENRVRTEIEWLRRGPKARTGKSKARIDSAQQMIGELTELNARARTATAAIDFLATGRKTKRLIELEGVELRFGEHCLFSGLDFILTASMRVGLAGPNGSGKTSLLRLLLGDLIPSTGAVRRAQSLHIVHFDQNRQIDSSLTLARALAPDSDSVAYDGRVIHVASWAARFLFTSEQLNQPVSRLSGGERARILIAKLMLEPADVLLLDEPTNDLDIQTLEILEESLLEYQGAFFLVTHDRYLLDRVCASVLGLDGQGAAGQFSDYSQWDAWQKARRQANKTASRARDESQPERPAPAPLAKKKLSYLEAREFATLEPRIVEAEEMLKAKRASFEDPAIASDADRLLAAQAELQAAQKTVDDLYTRWTELEEKRN